MINYEYVCHLPLFILWAFETVMLLQVFQILSIWLLLLWLSLYMCVPVRTWYLHIYYYSSVEHTNNRVYIYLCMYVFNSMNNSIRPSVDMYQTVDHSYGFCPINFGLLYHFLVHSYCIDIYTHLYHQLRWTDSDDGWFNLCRGFKLGEQLVTRLCSIDKDYVAFSLLDEAMTMCETVFHRKSDYFELIRAAWATSYIYNIYRCSILVYFLLMNFHSSDGKCATHFYFT